MSSLYISNEVEIVGLNINNLTILYIKVLEKSNNLSIERTSEISEILTTIFETYKNQNIKYGVLYDVKKLHNIPSVTHLDFWSKYYSKIYYTLYDMQQISVILTNADFGKALNNITKVFEVVGDIEFSNNYDDGINIISEHLKKLKVPKKLKNRLKKVF